MGFMRLSCCFWCEIYIYTIVSPLCAVWILGHFCTHCQNAINRGKNPGRNGDCRKPICYSSSFRICNRKAGFIASDGDGDLRRVRESEFRDFVSFDGFNKVRDFNHYGLSQIFMIRWVRFLGGILGAGGGGVSSYIARTSYFL